MGSEQDRGWTVKTECHYANLRGGNALFYESQAIHPIYGETTPARSIDEQTAYQETLARISRIEHQLGPATPMMDMVADEAEAPNSVSSEIEQVTTDPLAAEFGYMTKPLNLTRRVENSLANHRRVPRRRPAGHITLK